MKCFAYELADRLGSVRGQATRSIALFFFGALSLAACAPQVKVVRQASPNPLVAQSLAVERVRPGAGITELAEADELANCFEQKIADEARGYAVPRPAEGRPFYVRPTLVSLDASRIVARTSAQAELVVRVVDGNGNVVDEISVSRGDTQSSLSLSDAGKGSPVCQVGKKLASGVLSYLEKRTGG